MIVLLSHLLYLLLNVSFYSLGNVVIWGLFLLRNTILGLIQKSSILMEKVGRFSWVKGHVNLVMSILGIVLVGYKWRVLIE